MRKILLGLFAVLLFLSTEIKAQYVTIPDARFVNWLHTYYPSVMSGNQMDTTNSSVITLTSISITSYSISDLTGIQYFDSLTGLDCSFNQLSSLPKLPNLLTSLYCSNNQLTGLPHLPNALTYLDCRFNKITSLPTFPLLHYFYCDSNRINNLPNLPNSLYALGCSYNQLSTLPALPDSLKYLSCSYNQLTSLPTLPNLFILECNNNQITCFPTFPNSINPVFEGTVYPYPFQILNNPFTCLPNYITAMDSTTRAHPLCATGNANGCAVAGIEHLTNNQLRVYPNPVTTNFVIETNILETQTIQIFDVTGKLVLSQNTNTKANVNASALDNGVYFLQAKTNTTISVQKIIIQR